VDVIDEVSKLVTQTDAFEMRVVLE